MKNKSEILKTLSVVLYLVSAVFFVLSVVGAMADNGIVQPQYLLLGAIALGAGSILKNAAGNQK